MKRVVIESPYAGDVETNVAYARRCILDSLRRGEAPYASHVFFTQPGLLDDDRSEEREMGIAAGLAWGATADLVAAYVDRGFSVGMLRGIREAARRCCTIEIRAMDRIIMTPDDREVAMALGEKQRGASLTPIDKSTWRYSW